jgi:SecD/SecF fusion protein
MNVTLEIQAGDAIRVHALDDNSAGKKDVELIARIDKAIAKAEAQEREDAITRATEGENAANVIEVYLANMSKEDLQTIYGTTETATIAETLNSYVTGSVENMHRVLGERIDLLGVVQPNIQQIRGTNRILVELPGVDDPENAANSSHQQLTSSSGRCATLICATLLCHSSSLRQISLFTRLSLMRTLR